MKNHISCSSSTSHLSPTAVKNRNPSSKQGQGSSHHHQTICPFFHPIHFVIFVFDDRTSITEQQQADMVAVTASTGSTASFEAREKGEEQEEPPRQLSVAERISSMERSSSSSTSAIVSASPAPWRLPTRPGASPSSSRRCVYVLGPLPDSFPDAHLRAVSQAVAFHFCASKKGFKWAFSCYSIL